jgi:catechol 2,3-dioxygenase-like lactoylglutathione lyase family enzyme
MNTSVKFYSEVLGFKMISDKEITGDVYEKLENVFALHIRVVLMQLGDEQIELTDYLTSGGRSIPESMQSNDLYFQHIAIVVSDMDKAYEMLRNHKVMHVSTAPQTIPASNAAAAGIRAFYFHDPDMHALELIYFPKGKGQPKWQNTTGKLFLGIDHTAIAISSTENSLHFYESLLGIQHKGESWNMGMEQAHLNAIENASLHITGLRAESGAGIELLQYIYPGTGKPYPPDSRADDVWHWQTTLYVNDAAALYSALQKEGYKFISKQIVELHTEDDKKIKAFLVRDPDGHAMFIQQSS